MLRKQAGVTVQEKARFRDRKPAFGKKERTRSGRGRTELADRRLQVTDHKKYGVMGRTASGGPTWRALTYPYDALRRDVLLQLAGGFLG